MAAIIIILVLLLPLEILIVGFWLYLCKKAYGYIRETFDFLEGIVRFPELPTPMPPRKSNED